MNDSSPTLVLVPGLLSDRTVWEPVVARFAPKIEVVVADLSTQDSIADMARDTLAATAGPLIVVGHSMGARVALEMVRMSPDRIARLALFDTGIHPRNTNEEPRRRELVELAHTHGMSALAKRWLPPMVLEQRHGDRDLMGTLTDMVERMTPELHARQIRALLNRPDARAALASVTCPLLIAVGRQDQWSPVAQHEEMQALVPHAELTIIEDAGHFAPIERPEAVVAALERFVRGD